MNKTLLRKYTKVLRKTLDIDSVSNEIVNNIRKLEIYRKSRHIMLFYPLPDEINLLKLLDDDKIFYLPRIKDDFLQVCPYKKGDSLVESVFKTKEPISEPVSNTVPNIIFVPALCADKKHYRLGYGKGFYDRFLKNTKGFKITPIPSCFVVDNLEHEKHDEKVDLVITEFIESY